MKIPQARKIARALAAEALLTRIEDGTIGAALKDMKPKDQKRVIDALGETMWMLKNPTTSVGIYRSIMKDRQTFKERGVTGQMFSVKDDGYFYFEWFSGSGIKAATVNVSRLNRHQWKRLMKLFFKSNGWTMHWRQRSDGDWYEVAQVMGSTNSVNNAKIARWLWSIWKDNGGKRNG